MADCLSNRVAAHVVLVGQYQVGGKSAVVEVSIGEPAFEVNLKLGPQGEWAGAIKWLSRHAA